MSSSSRAAAVGAGQQQARLEYSESTQQLVTAPSDAEVQRAFGKRSTLTWYEIFKVVLFTVTLIAPLRLLAILVTLLLIMLGLVVIRVTSPGNGPGGGLSQARQTQTYWLSVIGSRVVLFLAGFWWIRRRGALAPRSEAPMLLLNHVTVWDTWVLTGLDLVSPVSKAANWKIPVVGFILTSLQGIAVHRDETAGARREETLESIRQRAARPAQWLRVGIFPEGTTTNGSSLLRFRPGAFQAAVPVQCAVVRYRFRHMDVSWQPRGNELWLMYHTCCQFSNSLEIDILPPYRPDAAEIASAPLYADNVRRYMAKAMASSGSGAGAGADEAAVERLLSPCTMRDAARFAG